MREVPRRHWRSYGTDPLPGPAECDRCGKVSMLNEADLSCLAPLRCSAPLRNALIKRFA
jgi:hypothetical protein